MTKRIFAAIMLLVLFAGSASAFDAVALFGWPPADGSVTNAKLAEPVSVSNGGTGKTTAAEALAALGGASLNGSSTVDFLTEDLNVSGVATFTGFTKLGDAATGIKMKVLTGTTSDTDGGSVTVAHGLTGDSIVSLTGKVIYAVNGGVLPFHISAGYKFTLSHNENDVTVFNIPGDSANILSKPFILTVWYKE